jgi:hypothetical protein
VGGEVAVPRRHERPCSGEEPSNGQTGKAELGKWTTEGVLAHIQARRSSKGNRHAQIDPTQPPMKGWSFQAQPSRKLKGTKEEGQCRREDVGLDANRMAFERSAHLRVKAFRAWTKAVHRNGVGGHAEAEEEGHSEASSTHNV